MLYMYSCGACLLLEATKNISIKELDIVCNYRADLIDYKQKPDRMLFQIRKAIRPRYQVVY